MTGNNEILDNAEKETEKSVKSKQYLTFSSGEEVFAVEMPLVQEIIHMPELTKVPLAPSSLVGLINLRGAVIPVISLRKLLHNQLQEKDEASRIIIANLWQPVGFLVDSVSSVVDVEKYKIEDVNGRGADIKQEYLKGAIIDIAGLPLVMILSFEALVASEFSQLTAVQPQENGTDKSNVSSVNQEAVNTIQAERKLVSFSLVGQDYAVDISFAREIVLLPDTLVKIPNAPPYLLGLINLRSNLLPLISLKNLFSLDDETESGHSRILVLSFEDVSIGLVTDTVSEVLRVPVSQIDPVPSFISNLKNMMDISQVCRIDNGNKLVSIISVGRLFEQHAIQDSIIRAETMKKDDKEIINVPNDVYNDAVEQMVIFKLAVDDFGVPISYVQEIVRVPDGMSRIPKAPDFVEGVLNLRGVVVPVIDLRKRLGFSAIERNEQHRIIVFTIKGTKTGFIVDTVSEVLKIPVQFIVDAPRLSNEQAKLLGRVANLEEQQRVIQLLNPDYLLEENTRIQLENIEGTEN